MIDQEYANLETDLAFKFIIHKVKDLIVDDYGQHKYVDQVDEAFEDIFGVKKFISRLEKAYDNRETKRMIHNFGFPILMVVTNTPRYYSAIKDMIQILIRIDDIKHEVKRNQKKGKKKDKQLVKEYEYLQDLYKDSCKAIRKKLQIKKKSDYKNRYRAAADLANRDNLFSFEDDDPFLEFGDTTVPSSRYSDVKIDDDSEFARMLRRASGADDANFYRNIKKKKRSNYNPESFDVEDEEDAEEGDEDDDDDEDDEDDRRPNRIFKDDYEKKLAKVVENIQNLTTVTQMLVNERMDTNQSEAYVAHKMADKMRPKDEPAPASDSNLEIADLKNAIMAIVKSQKKLIDNVNDINSILDAAMQPDEDDSEVVSEDELRSQYNTVESSNVRTNDGPVPSREPVKVVDDRPALTPDLSQEQLVDYCNKKDVNMNRNAVSKTTTPKDTAAAKSMEKPETSE